MTSLSLESWILKDTKNYSSITVLPLILKDTKMTPLSLEYHGSYSEHLNNNSEYQTIKLKHCDHVDSSVEEINQDIPKNL